MLVIENLHVSIQDGKNIKKILQDFNLTIKAGEVHAIMGPNGCGKSTLANVLAGKEGYQITGHIHYQEEDLLTLKPDERALRGLFLGFQSPVEIPGVNNMYFLRTSLNRMRKHQGNVPLDAADFLQIAKNKIQQVGLPENFLHRAVNDGFSGGEKKRNEVLQMLMLEPTLIVLDEMDSGLDIDALQTLSACVNSLRHEKRSILLITHYQRLLNYIKPDVVHVMNHGKILTSGDLTLAHTLEKHGYQGFQSVAS